MAKPLGKWLSRVLTNALNDLPSHYTIYATVECLTEGITKAYRERGLMEIFIKQPWERFIASAVIYSNYHRELWFIGDCQALVQGKSIQFHNSLDKVKELAHSAMIQDTLLRSDNRKHLIQEIKARDFTQKTILPIVMAHSSFQNKSHSQFGHAVFDGFAIPPELIHRVEITDASQEICLASDGYPLLKATLAETETHLQKLLEEDPLCYKINPQIKGLRSKTVSYDDRAYIRFAV